MQYKDYYETLGVSRSANDDDIKKAYRRLARKYHPDVSKAKDAEERFKEVNEAYDVLRDKQKRQAYDQLGANWKAGQSFNPPPGWADGASAGGFADLFESLFAGGGSPFGAGFGGRSAGGSRPHNHSPKGEDITQRLPISVEEAYGGCERTVRIDGKAIKVKVPAGIVSGKKIRLSGKGQQSPYGGQPGDLYFQIELQPHETFRVDDRNVHVTTYITPWEAALGGKVPVKTLGGTVEITVPANSQSGRKMRLRERGLPGAPAGDQIVELIIHTPPVINDKDKKAYEKLRDHFDFDPRS